MSGNNYNGYYYKQPPSNYMQKQGSEWMMEQQQYNRSNYLRNTPYGRTPETHSVHSSTHVSPRAPFYNYNNSYVQNNRNRQSPRNDANNRNGSTSYKRRYESMDSAEPNSKKKKKKKSISQIVPSKKDWTMEEAELALNCEKEYNRRCKNQRLIIRFPDPEFNKDTVSGFHDAIRNVYFQQPSIARFCFVTLKENADADSVISILNQTKFGEGFLKAEIKKDREEDQNLGPEDIDPCTLYVGNLAQEITKEDVVRTYPKSKRIDIGFAKKMQYTRYAFVSFKTAADSIEAFKKTHSKEMHSKSLIVRFRRLKGTVGLPGEPKPQNTAKNNEFKVAEETTEESPVPEHIPKDGGINIARVPNNSGEKEHFETVSSNSGTLNHKPLIEANIKNEPEYLYEDLFSTSTDNSGNLNHKPLIEELIKKETIDDVETIPASTNDEESFKHKPFIKEEFKEELSEEPVTANHKPFIDTVIKEETGDDAEIIPVSNNDESFKHKPMIKEEVKEERPKEEKEDLTMPVFMFKLEKEEVKIEPEDEDEYLDNAESSEEENDDGLNADTYFNKMYSNMVVQAKNVAPRSKSGA